MKKTNVIAAVVLGASLVTACTPQVTSTIPNVIQVENVNPEKTVTISARETVKVEPDMAVITYGINTEEEDAKLCQQKNTEVLNQVLAFLKGEGFEDSSIATSGFSLDPMYDWSGNQRILTGYEMRTQVTVSDVPIEQVGALISKTVDSGANEILSVSYLSSKYDQAYEQALTKAVEQAKTKAESMAHAGGCQVAGVVSMEEYTDNQNGRYVESGLRNSMKLMEAAADSGGIEEMMVMAGEMQVTADIQVVFSLLPQ